MDDMTNEIDVFLKELFPINRSITGNGNRETLKILQKLIPLEILEISSGDTIFDWEVPKEWNIKTAWIKNSKGKKIIDFEISNLHVMSYSEPVNKKIKLDELKNNLHYLENLPDAIPYRTSYYNKKWGFCLSFNQFKELFNENEEYEVFIDSSFNDGGLSIGELLIKGKSKKEYLLSCYICHPSMANDSLSGVLTTVFLARELLNKRNDLEFSYRIIFLPETIGAIAYCAKNEKMMKNVDSGFVLTTCGGPGKFGYKQSFDKQHFINNLMEETFNENNIEYIKYDFDINGSDERQYSSQAFRINTITITKDKYYEYDYYHTSLDNLEFVKAKYIKETIDLYIKLINKLDKNLILKSLYPNCEVMLGKHGLFNLQGGAFLPQSKVTTKEIILWIFFYADGTKSIYEISKILDIKIEELYEVSKILIKKKLLRII